MIGQSTLNLPAENFINNNHFTIPLSYQKAYLTKRQQENYRHKQKKVNHFER